MAGLYLHIPFCRSRCIYCAFHSGTELVLRQRYVDALCHELRQRRDYLNGEKISTIYFGGGTPSLLTKTDFQQIFDEISANFLVDDDAEITVECNPDDLSDEYVADLVSLLFNRVSMGVQSFDDEELRFLRRRHTAQQAIEAVKQLQKAGFQNISIDLMFGLPMQTEAVWQRTLQQATALGVQHISAYSLTYEGDTPLVRMRNQHKIVESDEELCVALFNQTIDTLQQAGFEQYEISNFSLSGFRSRHNSSYWSGVPYLGVGAAAHSYNGVERRWNVADTKRYIAGIENETPDFGSEILTSDDRYNETIFTHLRTREGVDLQQLDEFYRNYCLRLAKPFIDSEKLALSDNHLRLTRAGIFVSDGIASELFLVRS